MTNTEMLSREGQILHHVLDGDDEAATELIRACLPGEVADLFAACVRMAELCTAVRKEHADRIHWVDGPDGEEIRHDGPARICGEATCLRHHT